MPRPFVFLISLVLCCATIWAQQPSTPGVQITVSDENGIAVPAAQVTLSRPQHQVVARCETDFAGRCRLPVAAGDYTLTVQKPGFYVLTTPLLAANRTVDVALAHQQEVKEVVNVVESPPAIDAAEMANTETLGSREIINVPYPTTRDIRQALPLFPGLVRDVEGQAHVAGAATYQTLDLLDGFNITDPVTGALDLHVSTDAVRTLDVESSRYSVEYGKGSGGVIGLATGMGDDHYRFSATNFIPSLQNKKGLHFDKVDPRATFSGPIRKGKAWFYDGADGEYTQDIVKKLPDGADTNWLWRFSNLAKVQVNLSSANILTTSLLVDRFHADHDGLSAINPLSTTLDRDNTKWMAAMKDQHYFSGGALLEAGFAASAFRDSATPLGSQPYLVLPGSTSGNYFKSSDSLAHRYEWFANLYLPPLHAAGRHDLQIGFNVNRLTYDQQLLRRPISILRADGTLFSRVEFSGPPSFQQDNVELTGFVQDRWSPTDRLHLEPGLRFDWDQILRRVLPAPRVAGTYLLTADGDTKLSAGVGLFYDATNLDLFTRPLQGTRLQSFYATDGLTLLGPPQLTSFAADPRTLDAPRFLNWSVGVQRKLPAAIYLDVSFLQKIGRRGFTFVNNSGNILGGTYQLSNAQRDRYHAVQVTVRRVFRNDHVVMFSYARSSARSNAVLDYTLDNPVFSPQAGGPQPWDAPNRAVFWGWLPAPHFKKWDVAWSGEWRSGFPFSVLDQFQRLVGAPDSRRFPDYFTLNLFLERRFSFRGYNLALRGGMENATGHENPTVVDNNIDSPTFLRFSEAQGRAFTARIRFLGRKK
jgi:hypothetical protein